MHILAQLDAPAGRQFQRIRPVRLVEVVHVNQIRRYRLLCCLLLDELVYGIVLAQPIWPQGVEIIPFLVDADAKADCIQGPLLTHEFYHLLQVGRGLELELFEIRMVVELIEA